MQIDLNCDMGEGMNNDAALMPFVSSANIACGYHAGNDESMHRTIACALTYNVAIGAHPGFADKENFGRTEQQLTDNGYYDLVAAQLFKLKKVAARLGAALHHVKPHGALYNMAAKDNELAAIIASAVYDFDPSLVLYGLSGSYSITAAKKIGLRTASEVFADRTYTDEGNLTPRNLPNALIDDIDKSLEQVVMMTGEQKLISLNGIIVPITAETICIHGDGTIAVIFAKAINHFLKENNIEIRTI